MHFQYLRKPLKGLVPIILALSVTLSSVSFALADQPADTPDPNNPAIVLKSGAFDPAKGEPAAVGIDEQPVDNSRIFVIQFRGPVEDAQRAELEALGVQILDYVPDFAYTARMDPALRPAVNQKKFVRWVGQFKPKYKLAPELAGRTGELTVKVRTMEGADQSAVIGVITGLGGRIEATGEQSVRAVVDASKLLKIAKDDTVAWIDEYQAPTLMNDRSRAITMTGAVWSGIGLFGQGQIVGVADTGLDNGDMSAINADFRGRIVQAFARARTNDWSDLNGHGTHVAGTILGNGSNSGSNAGGRSYAKSLAGIAPEAKLVMQSIGNATSNLILPPNLSELFQQAYDAGARIHNNSWGGGTRGDYDSTAADVDRFIYNHPDMTIVFAAGNDGKDSNSDGVVDSGSITPPGTAKNAITVGATEGNRPPGSGGYSSLTYSKFGFRAGPISGDYTGNNTNGMAAFSSRGPTKDGRIKPDIVAPGTNIASVHSSRTSDWGWGRYPSNAGYEYMGGTSMSAPVVSGGAALAREYFVKRGNSNPSAALIKATLLNGTNEIYPGQYGAGGTREIPSVVPNSVEGWGLLNLKKSLISNGNRNMTSIDNKNGLSTGRSATYTINVTRPAVLLRIMLVWSDYPAAPSSARNLVNDLDLIVKGPDGKVYYGNGKNADRVNNVEGVRFMPKAGTYTITVKGYNVPKGTAQPFALSMIGGIN